MQITVFIDPAAALRRGETRSGRFAVDVTPELVAALSPDHREELTRYIVGNRADALHADDTTPEAIRAALEPFVLERRALALKHEEEARENERLLRDPDSALDHDRDRDPGQRWRVANGSWGNDVYRALLRAAREKNLAEWRERDAELEALPDDALVELAESGHWCFSPELEAHRMASPAEISEARRRNEATTVLERAAAIVHRRNALAQEEKERQEARLLAEHRECERRLLAEHGTQSQRERWEAGVLPDVELREVAHKVLFAPLESFERALPWTIRCKDDCVFQRIVSNGQEWLGPYSHREWTTLRALKDAAARVPGATLVVRRKTRRCGECYAEKSRLVGRVETHWAGRDLVREYRIPAREKDKLCQDRDPKKRPSPKDG